MHVSFRNRLTLFFILLVIAPVLVVAGVAILSVQRSESSRTDVRLDQAVKSAQTVYGEARDEALAAVMSVKDDRALAAALRGGDQAAVTRRLEELAERTMAVRVRLVFPGRRAIEAGTENAVAPGRSRVLDAERGRQGRMVLSTTAAEEYVRTVDDATALDVLVTQGDEILAATVEAASARGLPLNGEGELAGTQYKVRGFRTPGFGATPVTVRLLAPADASGDAVSDNTIVIVLVLIAFLICALAFALTAARSLQAQINRLLEAARKLGKGDFSVTVPTEGHDEFAELGREFNDMARELETRLHELGLERARLQETVRRVGESAGTGLDRDAQLGILVEAALDGVDADCSRVMMRHSGNGKLFEAARAGDVPAHIAAVQAAEAAALELDEEAETQVAGAVALARPLLAPDPAKTACSACSRSRVPGRRSPNVSASCSAI